MKKIRNIGLAAHIDAGKTTTTERILFYSGRLYRMGEVDDGTATMDWMDQEQNRGITITSAATTVSWLDCTINIIDTPGHVDFTAEVERSMRVLDGLVAVFCAVGGVEAQSLTIWRQADHYDVPRLCYVNKMDRTGADFDGCVNQIAQRLNASPVPIQIPLGNASDYRGVIDLVGMTACVFDDQSKGANFDRIDIPPAYAERAEHYRDRMLEQLSEFSDSLMEKYLAGDRIPPNEIHAALRAGTVANRITPVLCGSSLKNKGIQQLLDAVCLYLPSPADMPAVEGVHPKTGKRVTRTPSVSESFSALAFKIASDRHGDLLFVRVYSGTIKAGTRILNATKGRRENVTRIWRMHANDRSRIDMAAAGDIVGFVGLKQTSTGDTLCDPRHPIVLEQMAFPETVISMAVEPKSTADRDKLAQALAKLAREDPTLNWHVDQETGQLVMSGMGELHLDVLKQRMFADFNVAANIGKPRVSYRETIASSATGEGKYIRQTGGRGLYGHVILVAEPWHGDKPVTVETRLSGNELPRDFIPTIEESIISTARAGVETGYPLIDVRVTITGGSHHPVDSSDVAFSAAAAMALRNAVEKAGIVLLEPIMGFEIVTPEKYLGDIINDLNARHADISKIEVVGANRVVRGVVPLREVFGYVTTLRSLSQGTATVSLEPRKYNPVPEDVFHRLMAL